MQSSPTQAADDPAADVQYSKKFHLWIDEPVDWKLKVRRLLLSGWCVAKTGPALTAVRARLSGRTFDSRFDRDRPEVADYLQKPDAPRFCGCRVDVEGPYGRRRLELQVTVDGSKWHKAFARTVEGPLSVSAAERALWGQIEERENQARFAFHVDRPADWDKPARLLHIGGW